MLQLSESANLFVSTETENGYQHTAGLVILSAEESPDFCFEKLRTFIDERLRHIPQFRWKLKEVPLGLDLPYWVEDEKFSIDRHIHRIAVPAPGDMKALTELAAYLYSHRLDRSRPLWEIWFIEGLQDNRYALLQKLHHCMMDGQGAQKIGEVLCDFEPDPPPRSIRSDFSAARTGGAPTELQLYTRTLGSLAQLPARTGRHVWSMLLPGLLSRARRGLAVPTTPQTTAPMLPCNGEIGPHRGFACTSVSLPEVKRIRVHFNVSINDVVLALIASSMRAYLLRHDALPREPARVSMAMSLRKDSDEAASNAVTSVTICVHTDLGDPAARLMAIHQETGAAKQTVRNGQSSMYELMNSLPPFALALLNRAVRPEMVVAMMKSNFVVSNVKGSSAPMYLAGARIEAMYPISLLANGIGLNLTCVSYVDKIDFGITFDRELMPDAWLMAEGLNDALREYLALAAGTRGKRSTGKPRKARAASAHSPTQPKQRAPAARAVQRKRAAPQEKVAIRKRKNAAPRESSPTTA